MEVDNSLHTHFGRPEVRLALVVGAANILWVLVAGFTFARDKLVDLAIGGTPAIIAAAYYGAGALFGSRKGTLRWKE